MIHEFGAVDNDEGRGAMLRDDRTGHDGLAGAGWRYEHPAVVFDEVGDCGSLLGSQLPGELELDPVRIGTVVAEVKCAADSGQHGGDALGESSREVEPFEVLAVAGDEPWRVPRREPHPLLLVELRVGDRPDVLECGHHRWRKTGAFDGQHRPKPRSDHRRRRWTVLSGKVGQAQGRPGSDRTERR